MKDGSWFLDIQMVHPTMALSEKTELEFFCTLFLHAWRLLKALEELGYYVSISMCLSMIQQV